MDGIVGRSISRMGKGSFKDITCASCFVFTSTTSKLEGGKRRGENGKGPWDEKTTLGFSMTRRPP